MDMVAVLVGFVFRRLHSGRGATLVKHECNLLTTANVGIHVDQFHLRSPVLPPGERIPMNTDPRSRTFLVLLVSLCLLRFNAAHAMQATELADHVFAMEDQDRGEKQIVITSERGLVVLNSFASPHSASRFKEAIATFLERDDFCYLINLVDRIDLFGGNAAYKEVPIVGHRAFWQTYGENDKTATREFTELIEMWRHKENGSRERLRKLEPDSEAAVREKRWAELCKARADELESGFSLILPTEVYEDRMALDLGDLTIELTWFGRTNYTGMTVLTIPEIRLAIVPGFILHPHHLEKWYPFFGQLDGLAKVDSMARGAG